MNQILIQERIYVTPELKKKKKMFKFEFIISVIALCLLVTYALCSEYDRNKSEQVSKEILANIEFTPLVESKEKVIAIMLNEALEDNEEPIEPLEVYEQVPDTSRTEQTYVASDGTQYTTIGTVSIPSIDVYYPILSTTSTELLKIAPCKFWGPNPNEVGNFCIVGHNYKNEKFFSKAPTLENGDTIDITDMSGTTITYIIYDKFIVDPENVACTSQETDGRREITLITCQNDNERRYLINAREM